MSCCRKEEENTVCNPSSLCTLIILILIVLQFRRGCCPIGQMDDCDDHFDHDRCFCPPILDNSILFVIALFFLTCHCSGSFK